MPSFAVLLQYALPHRFLSRLVMWATRLRIPFWKNFLIRQIASRFAVNWDEAAEHDLAAYPHFNAFFTRALKPDARRADDDPASLLMPADGHISQFGRIEGGRIFQAKGQSFTAAELLGDADAATPFANGEFITVYLSPRDYHRVHMPWTGTLRRPCMCLVDCSASPRLRCRPSHACLRATSAWSVISTPTSVRWRW